MALFESKETKQLRARVAELEAMLTPEMLDNLQLRQKIASQQKLLNDLQTQCVRVQTEQASTLAKHQSDLATLQQQIEQARVDLVETNETVLMQSFGLYTPRYEFANSTGYKDALSAVREKQKTMVKQGTAATGYTNWTIDGSAAKGQQMVRNMQKLVIRAFNCECDDVVEHVKFSNFDASIKRISTAFSTISKLGASYGVAITGPYRDLKLQELRLAYEFQIEKQNEKERVKQLRADERERAKLEKEIAEARRKIEKEQNHYANALTKINQQIDTAAPEDIPALEAKKAEIQEQLDSLGKAMEQVDYREANQKAGYVYIISNIGAFGEGVYKIGMTRRLEPMDRIDELGDASVPFNFDVHALIFSEDAPALEAALHRAFEDRKLNMVNHRREFFRVSLDEIKQVVVENFDKTVEFIDIPSAEQYRQSELMRNA